ncbi:toll/interleukin-1 receptor domain-containing protein [Subtercola vilae]|uniref:Toll-Interleukin receptor n=1 Tax=Subtercola vilae TaxID=2056433 RepID=A0A4T2BLC6_9MICO|nr:toll/interleukin-1 receptor domain-containing protein [Subtercola vilae]TIH29828.1 toll-Interleukin receptor [Subtercola vilae]
MVSYTISEVRSLGITASVSTPGGAREILRKAAGVSGLFDIFLSHSFSDAELILGVRRVLQLSGKTVYIDWIDDPQLDRTRVSASTAAQLRQRMSQCKSLIYAATQAASSSKWMPWELGYFDGMKGSEAVAVMPLVAYTGQSVGQEYLDLYPTVEKASSVFLPPKITKRVYGGIQQKSLDDLVTNRGGTAWHR